MIAAGRLRHPVILQDGVVDGQTPTTYQPSRIYAAIEPSVPGAFDEQRVTHQVTIRYHAQVGFNTRILHRDRYLYVRGIQNVDERNVYQVLLCEEVLTPDVTT